MKNFLIIAVALVVVVGAAYLLSGSSGTPATDMPAAGTIVVEESTPDDSMDMSDTIEESPSTGDMNDDTMDEAQGSVKEFTLDAFKFGYSMDEIVVNEGDTVTITLTNSDGFHDWVVDEFNAATDKIQAGDTTSVTFVADKAGAYEYYCSVGDHRSKGMVGTLIVQ